MELKLLLTSHPLNPDKEGTPNQVNAGNCWKESLVNKVSAGSLSSIIGQELQGEVTYIFALKIRRYFYGVVAVKIAVNAMYVQDEYSLCHIPLENIPLFGTINEKNAFRESHWAQQAIQDELLTGKPWEGMPNLHFGLWPMVIALHNGQDVHNGNLLSDKGKEILKDLGRGDLDLALANIKAWERQVGTQGIIDTIIQAKKKTSTSISRATTGRYLRMGTLPTSYLPV
jgi:hypothetical protein